MTPDLLGRFDGILFTGGMDIQPEYYGEGAHELTGEADQQLDGLEVTMVRWALQNNRPILGVCRGMQLINVALGGTLYQDINDQVRGCMQHNKREMARHTLAHSVHIEEGSRAESILGTRNLWVNSLHHQAVNKPGRDVIISGRAEDGIAELLEVPEKHFVVAVSGSSRRDLHI